jgi:hypothetical protein
MRVQMNGRNIMQQKHSHRSQNMLIGGAVPLLLNKIIKRPEIAGGSIGSNRIVGIISPAPVVHSMPNVGGELLNKISFGKNVKHNHRDNIKFLF